MIINLVGIVTATDLGHNLVLDKYEIRNHS